MSAEKTILNVTLALNTSKKKEKLSALENLTDLLNQEAIVKSLNRSSKEKDNNINWEIIFIRAHNAILSLIDDNNSKSRQLFDKHLQIIQNVMAQIVHQSCREKVLSINSNLIVSCILTVFETDFRIRFLGCTYINLLIKYILSERKNWCYLKDENWIGIKNICQKHFSNPPQGTQGFLFLEILINVIRYSSKNCLISHNFLDLFDFLKEIFVTCKKSGSGFEIILLRLTNTLCLQLAIEFRYKVCEFMESVFDSVIPMHEIKKPEKNILIYHYFMTTLNVHNPDGTWEDKTAYACNLKKWKSQVRSIFFLCHEEIKVILKNASEIEMEFLNLFVYVTHLVSVSGFQSFPESGDPEVSYEEPGFSNKRKCSSDISTSNNSLGLSGKIKLIKIDNGFKNLLKDLKTTERWFWLDFLELILHKYQYDLKNEYFQIVEILYQLFCDKRNVKNSRSLLRCLCSLLKVENNFEVDLSSVEIQKLNEIWNNLGVELMRSFHMEACSETHILLRCLISNSKIRDPWPLIKLYCDGSLPRDSNNFETLCIICQNCILPEVLVNENPTNQDGKSYVRTQLLLWLLETEEKFPCRDLSKAVIALILKRFEEEIDRSHRKENILISRVDINDFFKLITNNYMTVAFKNVKFLEDDRAVEVNLENRLDETMKNNLLELLAVRGKSLYESLNKEAGDYAKQLKIAKDCVWFCELLCHILSYLEYIYEDNSSLNDELESILYLCSSKCLFLFKIKYFDLSIFSSLYDTNFHKNVQKSIRNPNFINVDLLKAAFEFAKDLNNENEIPADENDDEGKSTSRFSQLIKNPDSVLHFQSLTKKEKLIINSYDFLSQYVAVPGTMDTNRYQSTLSVKIIDSLVHNKTSNISSNFHLQLVLRVLYSFTKYDAITGSVLSSCLNLLESVCNSKYTDSEVIIIILQILKDLTPLVHKTEEKNICSKYLTLIDEFRSLIFVKKSCGTKAIAKFIECLAEIAKVDLKGSWAISERKGSSVRVFQDIIKFLKHPYHEIRLTAAQHLGSLFAHHKTIQESTIDWQKNMLNCVFDVLNNNSELRPKVNATVTDYFDIVISSVSLISWANIICCSSYWRKKALFYVLHLSFLKKFKKSEVLKIIKVICKELKINSVEKYVSQHFYYLLYKWNKNELQYKDFPYYLLGHHTVDDFIQNRYSVLVTVYLQSGQLDIMKTVSSKLKKSTSQILKECHSVLMSFILPSLSENVDCETAKKAQKLKRLIDEELSSKISIQLLTECLDEVIYNMIRNLHDPIYLNELCDFYGNFDDEKSPVSFNVSHIIDTLDNLSTGEGEPLLRKIAAEVPAMIQKILLYLQGDIERAIVYESQVFAFYKYIFFIEIISRATNKGSEFRGISTFIIRDVVYTVASIIRKDKAGILASMGCECLRKISDSYLQEFGGVFGIFLPEITTVLTPLAKNSDKKALNILNFLICENYSKLKTDIACLDPFPSDEIFCEINHQMEKTQIHLKSLRNVIHFFIKAGKSGHSGCRIEGLKNLRKMLSTEKKELKEMFEELKMLRGFSEDCKKSLLHQLICMLVELTSDRNPFVKIEAANCLGELGPSDLTTLVLRPENNFVDYQENLTALNRLVKSSLVLLSDLLISDNYEAKKVASKALHALLPTRQGNEVLEKGGQGLNVEYLTPFLSTSRDTWQLQIRKDIFMREMNNTQQWRPNVHEKWIVSLMNSLLLSLSDSRGLINAFRDLIEVQWQFAENIFPVVLDFILSLNEEECTLLLTININTFFEQNFDYKKKTTTLLNKTSVRCMVNVVDYIRIQRSYEEIYTSFGLNINYLHVAKAALYCSAFFTSIFYAELWFEEKKKNDSRLDINMICELYPEEGFALTEILRECHSKIGNSDGIHGCGYMHILDPASEIQHYQHLENWSLSLLHHDIQMSQGNISSEIGLLNSLERSGMLYTLNSLIKTNNSPDIAGLLYKCASRLNDWSLLESCFNSKNNLTGDYFDKCYYFCLKSFHEMDNLTFQNETNKARRTVISELTHCSLESSKNLYLPISELQCLKELEEFAKITRSLNKENLQNLFEKWKKQDEIKCSEFKLIESILTNRTIIIKHVLDRTEDPDIKNYLKLILGEVYCKLAVAARKEKKYETAIRTLSYLNTIEHISVEISGRVKLEKSRILWERGDKDIGEFLLSHFLKRNEITGELKAKSLRIYGDWMAKTKSENSREIIDNYYMQSIARSTDIENRTDSYASLAKFADYNYEQLNEYLSSPLFEIKQNLINTQQDLASELRQELGWNQNREKRMAYQIAAKQSAIDENEIKNTKAERDSYLNLALKYYLLSLKDGEKYNLVVFRVVSLWLSNPSNPDVIQQLQKILHHIPSYKFLCLLPQLVPRMADVCLISSLIDQILQDHPHHTLPPIFALHNSYEDLQYSGVKTSVSTPRVLAAKSLLEKFQTHQKLGKYIKEMHCFSSALIELANYNPTDKGKPGCPIKFPEHLKISRISNLTTVFVPSIKLAYNKNCIYDDVISVLRFEENYHLVGGVNLPKRIKCVGSDGVSRLLLVKGKDDLRQDAVMQQVFTIMNSLLYQNSESNKRKLVIRTYKVVPLSQRSGVIEWCENTQPLSLYLTGPDGKSGAHKKFYPNDTAAFDCRCIIRKVFAQPHVTNEDKLKVFLDICKQIHPVFHNFFIEKFPAPGVWFERRLAYIHSVATSSMIGYILGIGDRHVYNILIDNTTAEVIHIDLGIAFEQGKTLPTPETVPFRLTRDIVDGMGLSGIEGDFRISCVKTMEVLRENKDTILTLLEVLLYDPLYTWTITPEKAYSMQNQTETSSTATDKSSPDLETNKMAERALIRLKQKLEGTEAGFVATNVEGQVNYLIQQARDPNNLCRLFHGWQAYL